MRYYLTLLVGLGLSMEAFSQSTLYQTSPQFPLDHNLELFDKQFFSASLFDNTQLLDNTLNSEQAKLVELHRAMAALQIESPDGPGLMKSYILENGTHPSVTTAGLYMGNHFFYKNPHKIN